MVCLFHGDYGPPDPAFDFGSASPFGVRGWVADASKFSEACNIGEAEAIQRNLLRGEPVSWCDQGYAWVGQDAVGWFYIAAFLLVVLPYLVARTRAWAKASRPKFRRRRAGLSG
jgi:4-amino-4-deoxy-L-arabinose transferase-like glycosyltransferase